jgi:hypothetical protein
VLFVPYGTRRVNARQNAGGQREIVKFDDAAEPVDPDNAERMGSAGNATPNPSFSQLLVHADDRPRPDADRRVVAELLALRGMAGDFVVPVGRDAWRPLLAYHRLRPVRVRAARVGFGLAIAAGLGRLVGDRRTLTARPGDRVLLDYLSRALGEPGLRFAGTDRPCRDFVTPVMQLFTPDGRCVGFAKIGWDPVTQRMIDDEVEALRRVRAAGPTGVRVPAVLWHGYWQDLAVMVTAPMPTDIRRLPRRAKVPVDPLAEIATVDGPMTPTALRTSDYLRDATETGFTAATVGRRDVLNRVERIEADFGDLELTFGRWHGDWVPWNLGRSHGSLFAWDWAYSARAVPFGFDVLHFTAVPAEVLRGASRADAAAQASEVSTPALLALGLDDDQARAVAALHRLELELRDTRAWLLRRPERNPIGTSRA